MCECIRQKELHKDNETLNEKYCILSCSPHLFSACLLLTLQVVSFLQKLVGVFVTFFSSHRWIQQTSSEQHKTHSKTHSCKKNKIESTNAYLGRFQCNADENSIENIYSFRLYLFGCPFYLIYFHMQCTRRRCYVIKFNMSVKPRKLHVERENCLRIHCYFGISSTKRRKTFDFLRFLCLCTLVVQIFQNCQVIFELYPLPFGYFSRDSFKTTTKTVKRCCLPGSVCAGKHKMQSYTVKRQISNKRRINERKIHLE